MLAAPGNAGIAASARCIDVSADDVPGIVALVEREDVDLTVVGPEAPLVAGLADELTARGRLVFGPGRDAARIEGSKSWAKDVMVRHGIPTARAGAFTEVGPAVDFVDRLGGRAVVKADGLAGGKGVTVATSRAEAVGAIMGALLEGAFGAAGAAVVVEEILSGPEVSAFALCDGRTVTPLALSQDAKRIGDGDTGPNTGGMGAYSPLPWLASADRGRDLGRRAPFGGRDGTRGRRVSRAPVRGPDAHAGRPSGDRVQLPVRRSGDRGRASAPADGSGGDALRLCGRPALGREGRSRRRRGGDGRARIRRLSGRVRDRREIHGLPEAAALESVSVFHAGTTERDDRVVTAGGRVLAVSALGPTLSDARARAYEACGLLSFDGMQYRRDIAERAVEEESR